MDALNELIRWLIQRMEWVYGFVVNDLNLPSSMGYIILGLLILVFFADLFDIYQQRKKSVPALIWLAVVLFVPLGTLVYVFVGRRYLHNTPWPVEPETPAQQIPIPAPAPTQQASNYIPPKAAPTLLGSIVGAIALIAGAIGVFFFVMITIAIIQCQNDPKCM